MTEPSLSVEELFRVRGEALRLEHLNPDVSLLRECQDPDISTPGLALAGFLSRFPAGRMQVMGETEMTFLAALTDQERADRLRGFFSQDVPAAFVTKGQDVPGPLLAEATERGVPILRTALTTKEFFRRVKPYLEVALAPSTSVHGSLADVYGVGLLFVGPSGIGKSECVLDLVERGHRLVADDLVMVSQRGNDILIGRGHDLQGHHMEIRGVGIIDIQALFGIRAIRQQKRIEVVVRLDTWDDSRVYDRTGLDRDTTDILGVRLPRVTVPLNPGKNLTVISEVVAMNHLLRYAGVDSAADFDKRVKRALLPVREDLDEDHE